MIEFFFPLFLISVYELFMIKIIFIFKNNYGTLDTEITDLNYPATTDVLTNFLSVFTSIINTLNTLHIYITNSLDKFMHIISVRLTTDIRVCTNQRSLKFIFSYKNRLDI